MKYDPIIHFGGGQTLPYGDLILHLDVISLVRF